MGSVLMACVRMMTVLLLQFQAHSVTIDTKDEEIDRYPFLAQLNALYNYREIIYTSSRLFAWDAICEIL